MRSRVDTRFGMARANEKAAPLTTGELGKIVGLSPDTIRHYERLGLLRKAVRSDGGYRLYGAEAVTRVQLVQGAVKAGFSLQELAGILKERDSGGAPCHRVASLAADKLELLDQQIQELIELRRWLASTLKGWRTRLEQTPAGERAGLLDSLRERGFARNGKTWKGEDYDRPHIGSRALHHGKHLRSNGDGLPHARAARKER